jgi:DNA-binding response OmpR family regulator
MADALAGKRILIVEDDKAIRQLLSKRVASWDFRPLEAATGEEAVRIAQSEVPDLVLLDTILPKLKGREVCAILKDDPKTAHIPIIFLTALELPDHVKAGLDLGADDYITKPIDPEHLRRRIRVCLLRHVPPSDVGE